MRTVLWFLMLIVGAAVAGATSPTTAPPTSPATISNDDSCDISTTPAATLLLPYFEVEVEKPSGGAATTLFTLINTAPEQQIAHVTLWTDWAYPALTFNVALTGYDVHAINLYDVLVNGILPAGSSSGCPVPAQATTIAPAILEDVRQALTSGVTTHCGLARIGATHHAAVGFITIDVVSACTERTPVDPLYYSDNILFDNTLTGDYQQIWPDSAAGNFALGGPLVHIRAVPGGGSAATAVTNLPYTFYDRFTPAGDRRIDRRQPLPATFAARYIQGNSNAFAADFKIWREGVTPGNAPCRTYTNNRDMNTAEMVRFDEQENPSVHRGGCPFPGCPPPAYPLPATVRVATASGSFPPMPPGSPGAGGWMYLNLNNTNILGTYSTIRSSQNWVVVSMFAERRYGVDFDAVPLGNGCSQPAPPPTATTGRGANPIGPLPDIRP